MQSIKITNILRLFCFSILWFSVLSLFSANIGKISFEGLTKTKESYLRALIKSEEGTPFDQKIYEEDIRSIRSLNLFFKVDGELIVSSEVIDIIIKIKEAKYVYPIFFIGGFDTQFKLIIGTNNINWRGKGQTIGGYYQFYDRNTYKLYQKTPLHKNGITGHEIVFSKYASIEPLYINNKTSDFNFDNSSISIGGFYRINQRITIEAGGMFMHEKYVKRDNNFNDILENNAFEFTKHQIRFNTYYSSVNQHYELFDGIKTELKLENIETHGFPEATFLKGTISTSFYKTFWKGGNFAAHTKFGTATNNISPFTPFVLDGFINVRGIGNRVERGTAELITNLELRYRLFKHKYAFIQGVLFADFGTIKDASENFNSMFTNNSINRFAGCGLRLNSRVLYNSIFRIDFGVNTKNISNSGIIFGVNQFF